MLEVRMLDRNGNRYSVQPDGIDSVRVAVVHANGGTGVVRIHKEQINNLKTALTIAGEQIGKDTLPAGEDMAGIPDWIALGAEKFDPKVMEVDELKMQMEAGRS